MKTKIIPLWTTDLRDEYNRQLRAKRTKIFVARACVVAAAVLLVTAVAGMITTIASPLFSAIVSAILIAGFWGQHYLNTRH